MDHPEAMADRKRSDFVFPRWANYLLPLIIVFVVGGALYVPVVVGYGFSPKATLVGYQPEQPPLRSRSSLIRTNLLYLCLFPCVVDSPAFA